jgi:hypothetical protein
MVYHEESMSGYSVDLTQPASSYLFSTARLETVDADGATGSATAFFFRDTLAEGRPAYLITNKHVIVGQDLVRGRFHLSTGQERRRFSGVSSAWVEMEDPASVWSHHPNPEVDLCALRVPDLKRLAGGELEALFYSPISVTGIVDAEEEARFPAILQVAMVGYPIGLWDAANNLPIIRRGTTATHPNVDFDGRPEVVIDMACFPGSSGSPVVYFDRAYFGSTQRFLGVLYGGPFFTDEGEIVVRDIPTRGKIVTVSHQMVHLGYVIKAREVAELARQMASGS